MSIELAPVVVPDFGLPLDRPIIPAATYSARCDTLVARAGCDWVVVYADREHQANIAFLTGFEPRFEEALLLLKRNGERFIVTGNESLSYAVVAGLDPVHLVLSQSMSLMGQDRSKAPKLSAVLADCGIRRGDSIGLAGWKYLEPGEGDAAGYFVPHHFVHVLETLAGTRDGVRDVTSLLMHQTEGLRAVVDADEIALLEWGAARASAALWRALVATRPGDSEFEAAARMGYAGEPLSCHMMLSGSGGAAPVIGLSSPRGRRLERGDGVAIAVGYWGGLSARGGLLADSGDAFLEKAKTYFETLVAWYEAADIGVAGGTLYDITEKTLAPQGLGSALNPGHLLSHDEWMNTPIRRNGADRIASGMPVQIDIIPVPMKDGETLNCEDAIVFADEALRRQIAVRHPDVHARIAARRAFMADELGVALKPSILPLSSTPLCLSPFWLRSGELLVRA